MGKESFEQNILPLAAGKTLDNGLSTLRAYYCVKYRNLPNFLVWKFCGNAEFPQSFGQIARHYAETLPFHTRKLGECINFEFLCKCLIYSYLIYFTIATPKHNYYYSSFGKRLQQEANI